MEYGKHTMVHQQRILLISKIIQNRLFLQISFYTLHISKIFQITSLTAVKMILNYYIHYVHIPIFNEMKKMADASISKVTVPLSKIDFALLNAIRHAKECIHLQLFVQKQIKILLF